MTVSILIPAFRPTFLRQAIASVLTQGFEDLDILVSDDSGGEAVRPVAEAFADPRIRYLRTAGRIGAGENCRALWDACRTERLLFLFDDDLLMPHAVAQLWDGLEARAGAAFSFGPRYVIDATGRVTGDPPAVPPLTVFDGKGIAEGLVGSVTNHVGELSNVLIDRGVGLNADDLLTYAGLEVHVVADVAFYLNASRKGPGVRVGRPLAAFRRHGAQNSSPEFNPKFAIGIVEWELFIRGEYDAGRLSAAGATGAIEKLAKGYAPSSRKIWLVGVRASR